MIAKVTVFPVAGCALCRGWTAVSPQDAVGAGMVVRWLSETRWRALCSQCGRATGSGKGWRPAGIGWRWPRR